MEMWLKRSTLVLLAAALVVSGQNLVNLDENQKRVEVLLGSSVTFQCNLMPESYDRLRIFWYFKPSFNESHEIRMQIVNKSDGTSSGVSNTTKQGSVDEGPSFTYTLYNASYNNSGWYSCKVTVEIPVLITINSSGTEVVIMKSKEHTTYPSLPIVTATGSPADKFSLIDWVMWIILGISTVILIVLLIICVLVRRRCRRSRGEDPIYANTRPVANKQPSPRPGTELKVESSSKNLRNLSPGTRYDEGKRRYK